VVGAFEGLHRGPVSCGCVSGNGALLVLGGLEDCLVSVWRVFRGTGGRGASSGTPFRLQLKGTLTGHLSSITHLAVSHRYGSLVSSAEDGTVLLWDLGQMTLLGQVPEKRRFPFPISALQVRVLLCSRATCTHCRC
jgi:WD40 repeat protein